MVGTEADNYNYIRSIILILGIMIQVEILNNAGVFQFIALNLIKSSKGDPKKLLLICCVLSVLLSSINL
ncbi:MAG: hypothetical protein HWN67_04970 [Candidatus Helarchaeota archaeon]|nr:hypothetical protein [Candidatus Helarchaeota archaeon]